MHSTVKTIAVWVLILVAAIGLYQFVELHQGGEQGRTLSLTDFLDRVQRGEVADVVIQGATLMGHLTANREPFRLTVPEGYAPFYDTLLSTKVRVTILPPNADPWIFGLPYWVIVIGGMLWLAISAIVLVVVVDLSRFVRRELARIAPNASVL
jgi:hypothetical protein